MGNKSEIQWTDATWNIAVGCTKVDEDCKYCYMYRQSLNDTRYDPKQIRRTKSVFNLPLKYKETKSNCWDGPPLIFTSSLTDVFHPAIDPFRHEMWEIIRKSPHLTFQILTKRPERIIDHLPADWEGGWKNVWLGTSIGSQAGMQRLEDLLKVPAEVRFLSLEPLHGPLFIHPDKLLGAIQWVIIGGESGNENGKYKYRPCSKTWIESLINQCRQANVAVFVKQMGTYIAKEFGYKDRHGGDITEWPKELQIREFPENKKLNVKFTLSGRGVPEKFMKQ